MNPRGQREYYRVPGRPKESQRGVALAMVVWFIAAMSLLVVGIVSEARTDVRMAQTHIARAKTAAAGDGAINLLLARHGQLRERQNAGSGGDMEPLLDDVFSIGELPVRVLMVPSGRLLDLRSASAEQLEELFASAGAMARSEARRMANTVLQSRNSRGDMRIGVPQLQSVEGWLQVPGFDRALLDAVRDEIIMEDGAAYRLDALLEYNGRTWLRRRWVVLQGGSGGGLPWQFTRTEAPRVLSDTTTAGAP